MKSRLLFLVLGIVVATSGRADTQALTASEAVRQMGRGINLGNTMEAPTEGAWNNPPVQESFFADARQVGFTWARIPIQWNAHLSDTAPYAVDEKWLDRVEQVVDWGLRHDLFICINAHGEEWIKAHYKEPAARDRFDALWRQLAARFKDKSPRLIFELLHDPVQLTKDELDDLNARVLAIVRAISPTRLVALSSHVWPARGLVLDAAVPADDYVLGTLYYFHPPAFTFEGQGVWGSDQERADVASFFAEISRWSAANRLPLYVREFGVTAKADAASRRAYYRHLAEQAVAHGVPIAVWDNGDDFEVYHRADRTWNELKDILLSANVSAVSGKKQE